MKKRKLGIRFKKQQAREWGWTIPVEDSAELYDIETGESFEGVTKIQIAFLHQKPENYRLTQLIADVQIFVAAVDSYERED